MGLFVFSLEIEYLEIDFAGEYRITQTETQGRFGNGLGREFVEQFQLEYWRDSLSRWISYKDHLGRTVSFFFISPSPENIIFVTHRKYNYVRTNKLPFIFFEKIAS